MPVAPLRRRLLAGLVNLAIMIGALAVFVAVTIAGAVVAGRFRRREPKEAPAHQMRGVPPFHLSPPLRGAVWAGSAALGVAARNWRGPGYRVAGLRRVDARTGGPVTVQSAVVGLLFDSAQQALTKRLFRSRIRREEARRETVVPQVREIERSYAAHPERRNQAVMELYKANQISPLAGCGWRVLAAAVPQLILSMLIRDSRTVYDRLTRTIVIDDR